MQPICLAIDTTFDDTSVAILKGHNDILANLTLSQFKDHEAFGGVVPERASRKHLEVIHPLLEDIYWVGQDILHLILHHSTPFKLLQFQPLEMLQMLVICYTLTIRTELHQMQFVV